MKKFIPSIALATYFLNPVAAFADSIETCPPGQFAALCTITSGNFGTLVGKVVTILFILAAVVALIFLIWGGIKWIISGGDKSGVEAARNTIVAAVVGLIVVFLSYFILTIILRFFLGTSFTNFSIPTLGTP